MVSGGSDVRDCERCISKQGRGLELLSLDTDRRGQVDPQHLGDASFCHFRTALRIE